MVAAVWSGSERTEAGAREALGQQAAQHSGSMDSKYTQASPAAAAMTAAVACEGEGYHSTALQPCSKQENGVVPRGGSGQVYVKGGGGEGLSGCVLVGEGLPV